MNRTWARQCVKQLEEDERVMTASRHGLLAAGAPCAYKDVSRIAEGVAGEPARTREVKG